MKVIRKSQGVKVGDIYKVVEIRINSLEKL